MTANRSQIYCFFRNYKIIIATFAPELKYERTDLYACNLVQKMLKSYELSIYIGVSLRRSPGQSR